MATLFIPPMMRSLTDEQVEIVLEGETVGELINLLDGQFPGIRQRLCEGDGLKPGLVVAVDGNVSTRGLREKVTAESEVHFLPAMGGG